MGYIAPQIHEVVKSFGISIVVLSFAESSEFHKLLSRSLGLNRFSTPYWEQLEPATSINDSDGWKKIGELLNNGKVILFFDELEEKSVFELENSNDLVKILSESTGFVFYVAHSDLSKIVCFNDHDMLILFKTSDQTFVNLPPI